MEKIRKILVSQPKPETEKNPYTDLAEKHNLKIDFFKFIRIEGINSKEYRDSKIRILDHSAIVFTSKIAIDHFFRICDESRITVPDTMKYFCSSESIALYLQVYIVYRKRKIFFGQKSVQDLIQVIKSKHTSGKIILTLSDVPNESLIASMDEAKISYSLMTLFSTVNCDIKSSVNLYEENYDLVVLFTPAGIKSLIDNFPDFYEKDIRLAAFGQGTYQAIIDAGLTVDIVAPTPEAPSMTMAIDQYLSDFNKKKR